MNKKYVAYLRVSTERQGRSGLGLAAQREIIIHNVGEDSVVKWYEEVHSGKNPRTLPVLTRAKQYAKSHGCVLILAKTDRLRNTQQALDLVDELTPQGVFFCNVGPNADKFMLTLFFAFAEKERLEISIRTKAALRVLKEKGARLGRPEGARSPRPSRAGADAMHEKAVTSTANRQAAGVAAALREHGHSYRYIADYLNKHGMRTPHGLEWPPAGVLRLLRMAQPE